MGTIPSVQLFRNSTIITGRQAAINALKDQKEYVPDGGLILARYSEDGSESGVKTLLGIVRNSGSGNADLTIIDVEGAAENVQDAIKKISGETASQEGKFISAITQTNGVVNVEFGGVAAANVSVADEGNIFTATTVEGVLSEIQNYIGTGGTVTTQISDAINALNSEKSGTSNHITVGVEQVAGKITSVTVSDSDIASAALLGTKEDASTAQTAFGYIAKEVADRTAAINALSTSSTVTLEDAAGTESGVLKVYTIKQGGSEVGKINIPKDLVVTSGSVVKGNWNDGVFTEEESGSGTALKLVIANQTNPVYINTLDLVKDHTAGSGIAISDTNVISVQIAEGSENFLSVDTNGVKLSGVTDAISEASGHVNTIIDARLGTGVTTVATVTEQLKALSGTTGDASGVTSVEGAKKYTDDKLKTLGLTPVGGNGQVITTISQTDGKVSVTAATLGAENVSASPIDSGDATVAVTGTKVSEQIASLAKSIKNVDVSEQLANYYTKTEVDNELSYYYTKTEVDNDYYTMNGTDYRIATEIQALHAEVESTIESTPETTTTEAIKIVQDMGIIESITLGAFDCGTY